MSEDPIAFVDRHLRVSGRRRRDQVIRELNSHLEASRHDLELSGHTPEAAARESVHRFGDPAEVAEMLTAVHRMRIPRLQSTLAALLVLGALSAWLGTSHTFASSGGARHRTTHQSIGQCSRMNHHRGRLTTRACKTGRHGT